MCVGGSEEEGLCGSRCDVQLSSRELPVWKTRLVADCNKTGAPTGLTLVSAAIRDSVCAAPMSSALDDQRAKPQMLRVLPLHPQQPPLV